MGGEQDEDAGSVGTLQQQQEVAILTSPFQAAEREEDSKLLRIDFCVVVQVPWNRELGTASFVQGGAQQQQIMQSHGNLRKCL